MLQHLHHITDTTAPTLVLLHGYGSNMQDLFGLHPYLPPMNLLCFQAPNPLDMGGFAWYDIHWNNGDKIIDTLQVSEAATLVEQSIKSWCEQHSITGSIIAGGFSQGAILSLALLKAGFDAKGFLIMSGYMLPEWRSEDWVVSVPVLQTHGTSDHVIPFEWAKTGAELMEGDFVEFKSYPMAHNLNAQCIEDVKRFLEQF